MSDNSSWVHVVIRWAVPIFISLIICGNHYVRDSLGALEKQIENDLELSDHEYSTLNALYFFPNIITPFITGMLIESVGGIVPSFIYCILIVSAGHITFGLGVQYVNKPLMYIGKGLTGSMYETIDTLLPVAYLGPLFKDDFQMVIGLAQIFLRLGSVLNFIVSPMAYYRYGIKGSLWIASVVGCSAMPLFLISHFIVLKFFPKEQVVAVFSAQPNDPNKNEQSYNPVHSNSGVHELNGSFEESVEAMEVDRQRTGWNSFFRRLWQSSKLGELSAAFYMYVAAGSFLYGAIVPFWFFTSKFLQDTVHFNVRLADAAVAMPEGIMMLSGLPIGMIVSYGKWSIKRKLRTIALAQLLMTVAYLVLCAIALLREKESHEKDVYLFGVNGKLLAWIAVSILGTGFSVAVSLFWGALNAIVTDKQLSLASGLVSCLMNVLPAILPLILTHLTGLQIMSCLAIMAAFGAVCALISECLLVNDIDHPQTIGGPKDNKSSTEYEMVAINDIEE